MIFNIESIREASQRLKAVGVDPYGLIVSSRGYENLKKAASEYWAQQFVETDTMKAGEMVIFGLKVHETPYVEGFLIVGREDFLEFKNHEHK